MLSAPLGGRKAVVSAGDGAWQREARDVLAMMLKLPPSINKPQRHIHPPTTAMVCRDTMPR